MRCICSYPENALLLLQRTSMHRMNSFSPLRRRWFRPRETIRNPLEQVVRSKSFGYYSKSSIGKPIPNAYRSIRMIGGKSLSRLRRKHAYSKNEVITIELSASSQRTVGYLRSSAPRLLCVETEACAQKFSLSRQKVESRSPDSGYCAGSQC
jgi:hypothetical protein